LGIIIIYFSVRNRNEEKKLDRERQIILAKQDIVPKISNIEVVKVPPVVSDPVKTNPNPEKILDTRATSTSEFSLAVPLACDPNKMTRSSGMPDAKSWVVNS
jgi:hypothetical protein